MGLVSYGNNVVGYSDMKKRDMTKSCDDSEIRRKITEEMRGGKEKKKMKNSKQTA